MIRLLAALGGFCTICQRKRCKCRWTEPVRMPPAVAPAVRPALERIQQMAAERPEPEPGFVPMRPQHGCAGLCAGDGCETCQELADRITAAKATPNPMLLRRRLGALEREIAALTAPDTWKER